MSRGWRLLAASLLGAVLGALGNLLALMTLFDAFRIRRDLELFRLARTGLAILGFEVLEVAPVAVSYPLGTEPAELILFASQAVLISCGWGLVLAILAWPVARAAPDGRWLPAMLFTLGCLPALALPARRLAMALDRPGGTFLGIWLLLAGLVATTAWWLLRGARARRRVLALGGGIAAGLGAAAGLALLLHPGTGIPEVGRRPDALPRPPSVLLISIDSLRPDHLGCYGYPRPTSPSIDGVAAEGVRFTTAVAPTSWTLPSHLTLLSGLAPAEHGVLRDEHRLPLAVMTLAEALRGAGYRTVGIVGGPYLEARYGYAQGFDTYDDYTVVARSNAASHHGITSPRLVDLATRWLERWRGSEAPFFMFLHLWDVHFDYTPPPPYDTLFDPGYDGPITGRNYAFDSEYDHPMDPRDLEHVLALYDGEIAFTDQHLGRLLDWLREGQILDQTIVVITSDHGQEFFEHGERGHRNNLYDESLRVPLILRYPAALLAGATVEAPVRLRDVAPTILELAGLQAPSGFGSRLPEDPLAGHSMLPLDRIAPRPASGDLLGRWIFLRQPGAKLIMDLKQDTSSLFDLAQDPGEQEDVSARLPGRAGELRAQLGAWWEQAHAQGGGSAQGPATDSRRRELLRSLGYVD